MKRNNDEEIISVSLFSDFLKVFHSLLTLCHERCMELVCPFSRNMKQYFLYCWLIVLTSACNNFLTENKRLEGFAFQVINKSSLYSCAADCVSNPVCKSFNLDKLKRICQLNYGEGETRPGSLQKDEKYWYSSISKWKNVGINFKNKCCKR